MYVSDCTVDEAFINHK